jgi:branched-subunit amino acid transport protein
MWPAVLAASLGCYVLKLAGLSVPARVMEREAVRRVADLLPVALLSALIATQTFASGRSLVLDPRAAGLSAAALAVSFRAPFLVVVATGAASTALLRAAGA